MFLQSIDKVVHVMHVANFDAEVILGRKWCSARRGARDQVCVGTGSTLWWRGIFQVVNLQGCLLGEDHASPFESWCIPIHQECQCCKGCSGWFCQGWCQEGDTCIWGLAWGCLGRNWQGQCPNTLPPGCWWWNWWGFWQWWDQLLVSFCCMDSWCNCHQLWA